MLSTGTRVGPYAIVSWLGAGGTGEVYRARDTKLHREVALKMLPERLSRQPERLARLRQEARILASLNRQGPLRAGGIALELHVLRIYQEAWARVTLRARATPVSLRSPRLRGTVRETAAI
jgi:serine/threonine protein kinase